MNQRQILMPMRQLNTTKGMVRMRTPIRFLAVLALVLSLFAAGASAQTSTTGSVEGAVTDVNGAAGSGGAGDGRRPEPIPRPAAATHQEGVFPHPHNPPG